MSLTEIITLRTIFKWSKYSFVDTVGLTSLAFRVYCRFCVNIFIQMEETGKEHHWTL